MNAVAVTAVVNLLINAGLARLSAGDRTEIPLWAAPLVGGPSMIWETLGTFFILPLITCLLVTTAVWHDARRGALNPLRDARNEHPELALLPRSRLVRGAGFGALCFIALAPVGVGVLLAGDFDHVSVADFVVYKAVLGVALGAVVTPVITLCAMTDEPGTV